MILEALFRRTRQTVKQVVRFALTRMSGAYRPSGRTEAGVGTNF